MKIIVHSKLLEKQGVIGRAFPGKDTIFIQRGLPPLVKRHVLLHEKQHFKTKGEVPTIIIAGLKDPLGAAATSAYHIKHNTKKWRFVRGER